jgi:hypothetical protein
MFHFPGKEPAVHARSHALLKIKRNLERNGYKVMNDDLFLIYDLNCAHILIEKETFFLIFNFAFNPSEMFS